MEIKAAEISSVIKDQIASLEEKKQSVQANQIKKSMQKLLIKRFPF